MKNYQEGFHRFNYKGNVPKKHLE